MSGLSGGGRGTPRRGRTGAFGREKPTRASVPLRPGEVEFDAYRELLDDMKVSGAEVVRQALLLLHEQRLGPRRSKKEEMAAGG